MAFVSGSATSGIYFHTQDLTGYANDWSVTLEGDTLDVTNFGSTGDAKEFIRGLVGGSGSVSGMYDPDADATLEASVANANLRPLTIIPDTQAVGGRVYGGAGLTTSFEPSASVGGVAAWNLDAEGSNFGGGVLLKTNSAITSTGAQASVDNAASTANGGLAIFHFITDDVTTMTCQIQDSANDSDWANLSSDQTFTTVDSAYEVVTGTIDRYLRFNVSAFTGTSAVVIAAFLRFP